MADCKRKTANLFPLDATKLHVGRIENDGTIDYEVGTITVGTDSVTYEANTAWRGFYTDFIQVNKNEKLTFSPNNRNYMSWACTCYDGNDNFLGSASAKSTPSTITFTLLTRTKKVRINVTSSNTTYTVLRPMLNTGSEPLPYEPYGWIHSLRKLTTSTDTLTTLPADIYADGNNATVGLKGNTVQNGTPTPDSPITPQGTGERTGNLFDKLTMLENAYLQNTDGTYRPSSGNSYSCLVKVKPNTSYRVRATSKTFRQAFFTHKPLDGSIPTAFYNNDHGDYRTWAITFTSGSEDKYLVFFCYNSSIEYVDGKTVDEIMSTVMISEDTDISVPFEPYGYKIPISSANTITNVYLGEAQSTRKIKKLVLTGEENWTYESSRTRFYMSIPDVLVGQARSIPILSTHFVGVYDGRTESQVGNNSIYVAADTNLYIKTTNYSIETAFTEFLQQQYAAGTPVTVWYVLATEETAVVSEPLMKIGDYADAVSSITIPTITGKDTFDVETTLKPSEVSLSYTGWHDATVEEWDGSQWQ